ncbi:MAG: MFS transporter [Candidatus Dormibacteraeota bacterium]|nr:MFS transporter [Candidatus Dormibacteraeota bacterium]
MEVHNTMATTAAVAESPVVTIGSATQQRGETADPRRWIALAVMTLGAFMVLIDTTVVNVAIPSIRNNLAASYADTQWVVAGYQLAYAVLLVTGGRLGDIFGRRRLFLIGAIGFTITSVLSGLAQSPGMLVGSRIAQGLAAALLFPQGLSMITAVFPARERAKAFGIFGAAAGIAVVLGPLLGGLIIGDNTTGDAWRYIFLINVPVGLIALAGALRFVRETRSAGVRGIDLSGTALLSIALTAIVFPLLEGRDADWAPWTFASLVGGVVMLALFFAHQHTRSRAGRPTLVQTSMFRERAFSTGSLLALVVFAAVPSTLFTINLVFQAGLGFTALHAGLTTLGFSGGVFIGAIMGVRLEGRLGGRGVLALGTLLGALGSIGLIVTLHARGGAVTTGDFIPPLLAIGVGFGNIGPRLFQVVLARVSPEHAGSGSGVLSTINQLGAAVGVTVVGLTLFSLLGTNAGPTIARYTPQVQAAAVSELHVPQAQLASFARTYDACFVQRIDAKDPAAPIPGCPAATPALLHAPLGRVGSSALADTFVASESTALLINAAVFALAFVLVLALPRSARTHEEDEEVAA